MIVLLLLTARFSAILAFIMMQRSALDKGIGAATEQRENCLSVLFNPAGRVYQFN